MELKYHQATFELLGVESKFSETAMRQLEQLERKLQLSLPASVKEWYSLEGAIEILGRYSNEDHPIEIEELGSVPLRSGYPEFKKDIDPTKVIFLIENQSCGTWAINLNGSDDPPVLNENDSAQLQWFVQAEKFSTFVSAQVWDWQVWDRDWTLFAYEPAFAKKDLTFLQRNFREIAKTYYYDPQPSLIKYRFYKPKQRVGVTEVIPENFFRWELWGETEQDLFDLAKTVWQCGTLSETLEKDEFDGQDTDVLEGLRG